MAAIERVKPAAVIGPGRALGGRALTRRHRLMLLLAFEILVVGFAQAAFQPIRRPGIVIETTVTPNHVVT